MVYVAFHENYYGILEQTFLYNVREPFCFVLQQENMVYLRLKMMYVHTYPSMVFG